jgi:Xaa-Pro aminopeptidase
MQHRIDALRNKFHKLGISNFIVTKFENHSYSNIRYLCGYTGSNGIILVTPKNAYFLTDGRYINQAKREIKGAEVIIYSNRTQPGNVFVKELKYNSNVKFEGKTGIEAKGTNPAFYHSMREVFPNVELVLTDSVVEKIAAVKEADEIHALKEAAKITDAVFAEILPLVKPGVREIELSAEISYRHLMKGADKDSFDAIVASGPRSALPHGVASSRKIKSGEFVTFDFGCIYVGYPSDMTRTIVVGKATTEMRKVYNTVLEAQIAGVEAIAPGVKCADLDGIARKIITDAGYGDKFTHSLGHGLSQIVHALPVLAASSKDTLEPNNVVTVEPGIYIENFGGVRIEDDVLVTETGYEIFNTSPKDLIEL